MKSEVESSISFILGVPGRMRCLSPVAREIRSQLTVALFVDGRINFVERDTECLICNLQAQRDAVIPRTAHAVIPSPVRREVVRGAVSVISRRSHFLTLPI